jgi:hypothetical protein
VSRHSRVKSLNNLKSTRFNRSETFVIATLVQLRYKFVRKEGILGMARRVDVLACKPDELFLAVSQVELQLTRKSVKVLYGRKNIPIQVFSIM